MESEDRARAFEADFPDEWYEYTVSWMPACAYDNLAKAEAHLGRLRRDGVLNQIAGERVEAIGGATFETTSPIDDTLLAQVARGDARDVDAAAKAAKAAGKACKDYRSWLFALCFVSIGLETDFKELVSVGGGRPAIAYWLSQTANAVWTLFIAWLLWSGTFFTPAILPD